MKARPAVLSMLAALALVAGQAQAQDIPISIDASLGVAFPLGNLAGDLESETGLGASTGFGFRLGGAYWFTPQVAAYVGYSRYSFGVEDEEFEELGANVDWVDSGIVAGVRFALFGMDDAAQFSPWIEAGIASRTLALNVSAGGGSARVSFDRTLGFEAAGGVSIGLAERLALSPAVRYVHFSPDAIDPEEPLRGTIRHLAAEIGFSYRF
jgi:opacity protein-like surface antigen